MSYTNQTAFDRAARHLLAQRAKSEQADMLCLYRGPNNTKCAIGALISDDIYSSEMERNDVWNLLYRFQSIRDLFRGCERQFLWDLQIVHDRCGPALWREELKLLAEKYALTTEALNGSGA